MSYFEDEILKEIIVGEAYTARQLKIFVAESRDVLVLSKSDSDLMRSNESKKLRVLDKIEAFAHTFDRRNFAHVIPSTKSIVYVVE